MNIQLQKLLPLNNLVAVTTFVIGLAVVGTNVQAAENSALVEFKSLSPKAALKVATEALKSCRESGYQVGISVVDRAGVVQVAIRDQYAGPHTIETSRRKAWTSVSFKTDTLSLAEFTKVGTEASGIRFVENVIMAGGGVPIEAAGSLIGGVGVSGAPNGEADHVCAEVGIESIMDDLEF